MTDVAAASSTTPAAALPAGWPAMSLEAANAKLGASGARFEMEELTIRGVRTRVWKNCPPTLRDLFVIGRGFASRTFLVYENDRATFEAFARATLALASEFQRQGVRKGDRIAVIMRNLPEWPVAFFAASLCGAIVTPLNAWWTGAELEYGLTHSGTKIAVIDIERYERLAPHLSNCPALEKIYIARAPGTFAAPKAIRLDAVLGAVNDWGALPEGQLPEVALEAEDDATIFYTSGTTGSPKGALGTHRNITTGIFTAGAVGARAYLRRGEVPPDPATLPQRVSLLAVPFFHVTGCNASLIPAVFSGGKIVLMRKWDAEQALQLIERERVSVTGGVPTIAWQILEHPHRARYDLSSIEQIAYGGAPSAPELVRRILEVFPKAQAGNGWGMTETSASFSGNTAEDYANRPASCGPAPAVGAMKIMSADGSRELPVGETGELWVRGPMVVKGYWNNPAATAQ